MLECTFKISFSIIKSQEFDVDFDQIKFSSTTDSYEDVLQIFPNHLKFDSLNIHLNAIYVRSFRMQTQMVHVDILTFQWLCKPYTNELNQLCKFNIAIFI